MLDRSAFWCLRTFLTLTRLCHAFYLYLLRPSPSRLSRLRLTNPPHLNESWPSVTKVVFIWTFRLKSIILTVVTDSNCRGYFPAICIEPHTLCDLMGISLGALDRRLVHSTAPALLTKNCLTWHSYSFSRLQTRNEEQLRIRERRLFRFLPVPKLWIHAKTLIELLFGTDRIKLILHWPYNVLEW